MSGDAGPTLIGLAFGLGAALAYGGSAYLSAIVARQFGGWITNLGEQAGAILFLLPLAPFALGPARPSVGIVALILTVGSVLMLCNFLSYQLLVVAPVALVWPVLASNGALITLLAILVLNDRPQPIQLVGLGLVLLGVVATTYVKSSGRQSQDARTLFSTVPGRGRAGPVPVRAAARTLILALGVSIVSGAVFFILIIQIKHYGWYMPVALERVGQGTLALVLLGAGLPSRKDLSAHPTRWWLLLPAVGVLDGLGLASYALGNQLGSTAITAMSSSAFVVVPVLLGVLLLRERPSRTQTMGVAGVLVGLILLAV